MVMAWGEEGGTNCENSTDIYALPYAKQTARTEPRNRKGSSLVLGDTSGGVNTRGLGCGGGVVCRRDIREQEPNGVLG